MNKLCDDNFVIMIPARSGSKGVPHKNRKLLSYTLNVIPEEYLSKVWVNTDDDHIKAICREHGVQIFNRKPEHATDHASIKRVIHDFVYSKRINQTIIMLYLTHPQRTWSDIIKAYDFYKKHRATSLLCKKKVDTHPYLMMYDKNNVFGEQVVKHNLYRRQDYPKVFEISHYIAIFEPWKFRELNENMYNEKTVFFPITDKIDIDTPEDLEKFIKMRPSTTMKSIKTINNPIQSKISSDIMDKVLESPKETSNLGKIAVCTVTNDPFIIGTEILIYSFFKHNPWFDGDFIILHSKSLSAISEENKKRLQKIHRVVFREVKEKDYQGVINNFKDKPGMHQRIWPSLYTFETFAMSEYDRVVFLDSDMLITGDMKGAFTSDHHFCVTPDCRIPETEPIRVIKKNKTFNGGFLSLGKDYLQGKHKKGLIKYAEQINPKQAVYFDQSIMNEYFKDFDVMFLSSKFNTLKRAFEDSKRTNIGDTRNIHYVGEKPWNEKVKAWERHYRSVEKLWTDEYIEYTQSINSAKIAVIAHVYYEDLWGEISYILKNISSPFDLYVTTTNDTSRKTLVKKIKSEYSDAEVIIIDNKGSDVGGFIASYNRIKDLDKEYNYVLKLHTKKGLLTSKNGAGNKTRTNTYNSLAGTQNKVKSILSLFANDDKLGMVGPKGYLMSKSTNDKNAGYEINKEKMDYLRNRMGINDDTLEFFSGTMFWMKWCILDKYLKTGKLTIDDFNEPHAPDGTTAHAMERVFACMVRDSGHKIKSI